MSFSELQALVQQLGSNLELRTLLAAISKLESAPDASPMQKIDLLKEFLQIVEPQLQHCQPRDLVEVLRVCGKLGYGPEDLHATCLGVFLANGIRLMHRHWQMLYVRLQKPQMIASRSKGASLYTSSYFLGS
jgi:hypothetical protein